MSESMCDPNFKDQKIAELEAAVIRKDRDLHRYYLVERVLVAAGIVSDEKLQQAREIVNDLE